MTSAEELSVLFGFIGRLRQVKDKTLPRDVQLSVLFGFIDNGWSDVPSKPAKNSTFSSFWFD